MLLKTLTSAFVIFVAIFCQLSSAAHADEHLEDVDGNVKKVEYYLQLDKENLPDKEILSLTSQLIKNRHYYDQTTIAKAYILLADIAVNRGDLAKAFQFSQDGLGLNISEPAIKLNLLLKSASSYYAKGKFQQVKKVSDEIIVLAKDETLITYRLKGLGYRAVVFALIVDYPSALKDLQQIESILEEHQEFLDHIDLLEILATAHHYLSDYETAISMHLKLLNLRYKFAKTNDIGNSYFALASAYRQLNRFNDAYDAFWQAKQEAVKTNSPIKQGYAELGLGEVLYSQQSYQQAFDRLTLAEQLFSGRNLSKPYLSTLIVLAKVNLKLGNKTQAYKLLMRAEFTAKHLDLSAEQIELYKLLSEMYEDQNEQGKAWQMLNQYITLYSVREGQRQSIFEKQLKADQASQHNRKVTLQLALKSEFQAQFAEKFRKNKQFTDILILIILALIILLFISLIRKRNDNYTQFQHDHDVPLSVLPNSSQTKIIYQKSYKMARKYQYKLSVGYLLIHNWQELTFKCNKKELNEVKSTLATVINEYKGEFDLAGILNRGEYILIFPHQDKEQVEKLVAALTEALKVRFFANLGEIAVNIDYALDTLNVQDIDPFIFLSRLTESIKNKVSQVNP
ncbi:MAG: tetratricopeptide repeat protein [Thalassotalea sp.]